MTTSQVRDMPHRVEHGVNEDTSTMYRKLLPFQGLAAQLDVKLKNRKLGHDAYARRSKTRVKGRRVTWKQSRTRYIYTKYRCTISYGVKRGIWVDSLYR